MSYCFCATKKTRQKGTVKAILPSEKDFWNTLNKNNSALPSILADGSSSLYILVSDIDEELEKYILTGKTEADELHVFSREEEQSLISKWKQLKLTVKYRSQRIEYMNGIVTLKYLQVRSPKSKMSISLIPWFTFPSKPYTAFVYIYLYWHYHATGKKSQSKTACATGKLFGIETLDKSTVCRNIKAMETFIDISQIDRPLAVEGTMALSSQEIIGRVPEILESCPPFESLREMFGEAARRMPEPISRRKEIGYILSGIPDEYSKVAIAESDSGRKAHDARKRPSRRRSRDSKCVQRPMRFIGSSKREEIRKGFIEICRHLVLDMAVTYHRFLQ